MGLVGCFGLVVWFDWILEVSLGWFGCVGVFVVSCFGWM